MSIEAGSLVWRFRGLVTVTTASPLAVASNAYSVAADTVDNFVNTDNAPYGAAVLQCSFNAGLTVGDVALFAQILNIGGQAADDAPMPSDNYPFIPCGVFPLYMNQAASAVFRTTIETFDMPALEENQAIKWVVKNQGTGASMNANWLLRVNALARGAKP